MRRFYADAGVTPESDGFAITLDGRPVRTPGRAALRIPTRPLAEAIAAEWMAQGDVVDPASMPLTGLANAAIDLVMPDPPAFAAPLAAYGESDLLCYRAPDQDLAAAEAAAWNPILAWAEARFDVDFILVTGVIHRPQPAATIAALRQAVAGQSPFRLAALSPVIRIAGSLVIGLALSEAAFAPDTLWQAIVTDELWQEARWGCVDDAEDRREHHRAAWFAAAQFIALSG